MKTIIPFVFFLSILANIAYGQVKFRVKYLNDDSLTALISEKDGKEKIKALNLLSNVICRKNIDSSILLANQAIELSNKLDYQKGLADGYFNLCNGYFLLDSLPPTISNYLKALRIYEDLEPTQEYGNLCMQFAFINYITGRFENEPDYGKLAMRIFGEISDSTGLSMLYLGTATLKELEKDWDSALYYTDLALSYLDPEMEPNEAAIIYNEKGLIYYKKKFRNSGYNRLQFSPKLVF